MRRGAPQPHLRRPGWRNREDKATGRGDGKGRRPRAYGFVRRFTFEPFVMGGVQEGVQDVVYIRVSHPALEYDDFPGMYVREKFARSDRRDGCDDESKSRCALRSPRYLTL